MPKYTQNHTEEYLIESYGILLDFIRRSNTGDASDLLTRLNAMRVRPIKPCDNCAANSEATSKLRKKITEKNQQIKEKNQQIRDLRNRVSEMNHKHADMFAGEIAGAAMRDASENGENSKYHGWCKYDYQELYQLQYEAKLKELTNIKSHGGNQ
jgi:hypothetical protein